MSTNVLIGILLFLNNIFWMAFFYLFGQGEKREIKITPPTFLPKEDKKPDKDKKAQNEETDLSNVTLQQVKDGIEKDKE